MGVQIFHRPNITWQTIWLHLKMEAEYKMRTPGRKRAHERSSGRGGFKFTSLSQYIVTIDRRLYDCLCSVVESRSFCFGMPNFTETYVSLVDPSLAYTPKTLRIRDYGPL